jgi:hypothetical protein
MPFLEQIHSFEFIIQSLLFELLGDTFEFGADVVVMARIKQSNQKKKYSFRIFNHVFSFSSAIILITGMFCTYIERSVLT